MTEPRRIAALSIAERVSEILGEPCGKTCGYKIHLENKISSETKIEVVTEAVLSRILQNDPSLEGYSVILIDEFHERSVTTDLNLAFLKEAMELRDDLFVIIMSATIETKKLSEYLAGSSDSSSVPVLEIPGRTFPVEVEYKPDSSPVRAVYDELDKTNQVILTFLPGIKEIRRAENELRELLISSRDTNAEIHVLHSSVSLSDQKKIFSPLPENTNRVILSSAIAETSLTVPGVTTVIDSGLARINRINLNLGMESLVTESESEFSAEQRKGRAGRTQAGRCIRLWNKNDPRQKSLLPEILRSDITSLVLECAAWGKNLSESQGFFLDSPSAAGIKTSSVLLQNMNFLDSENKITTKGRLALEAGLSPRLANLIFFAAENPSVKEETVQLILKYSNYAETKGEMQKRFCDDIRKKIQNAQNALKGFTGGKKKNTACKDLTSALIFSSFPDRLAKKCDPHNASLGTSVSRQGGEKITYQFPNGHTAVLAKDLTFSQAPAWLIAPEVLATSSGGTIFSYEPVSEEDALSLISDFLKEETECFFNEDCTKISKFVYTRYGKITLSERKLAATKEDSVLAYCTQIKKKGLNSLNLSHKLQDFLVRAQFYADHKTPENADKLTALAEVKALLEENPEEWLSPFLTDGKLTDEVLYNAIYWFLKGDQIDSNVPVQLILSNGRKAKVSYELNSSPEDKTKLVIRPVIEIIIQRIFGCMESPKIMGIPVLLKLLSPASRPLQITEDLAGFWNGSWIEICKEMKGRYPKHNWDYRIAEKD